MKLLFVADTLETFKTYKDTTFAMMRTAAARGHALHACEPKDLVWERGGRVCARARAIALAAPSSAAWFVETAAPTTMALADADAVLMRKDPPFDSEYFYATHLLSQAEREGARVFNSPRALREHPEKLAILEFPQYIAPTIVTRDEAAIKRFHGEHRDIVLKPLDGMGGMGIFRVGPDGLNLGSIAETLNRNGTTTVMAQRYLTEISAGDKRILVIDGVPVPHALARIPAGQRDPRQPRRRRQGRRPAADGARPRDRRSDRADPGRARAAARRPRRHRRQPHRDQRDESDRFPGDHAAERLRRRRDVRRRARERARLSERRDRRICAAFFPWPSSPSPTPTSLSATSPCSMAQRCRSRRASASA
jgi:glutathione synthase